MFQGLHQIIGEARRIGVIGSGGKTTLIARLARELAEGGERVLITTTTQLFPFPDIETLTNAAEVPAAFKRARIVLLGSRLSEQGKVEGFAPDELAGFGALADRLLIEGDGARGRSLKVHLSHDPVMPDGMNMALMVLGAGAIGRPASVDTVHRLERAPAHWGLREGKPIDAFTVARMALAPDGYRGKAGRAPLAILVNQADEFPTEAEALAKVLRALWPGLIFVGSGRRGGMSIMLQKESRPALILLAAGRSRRWPGDKRRTKLAGRPLLKWSLAVWRDVCLEERLAVVGPGDEEAAAWACEAGFRSVICEEAGEGLSASIRAGLAALPRAADGALIALGDMPALTPESAAAVVAAAYEHPARVIRPRVGGRAGHPVYLPRAHFEAMAAVDGDRGARDLLPGLDPFFLDLDDEGAILDLDRPEDMGRLEAILKARDTDET